ncbi:MAG: hypothetical protein IPL73_24850 [Candidatus Obscuribacter sp.]|nr:hypothetical protein [Candidatus Obscuribacter sp.]
MHLDLALDQAQTGVVETFVVIESHDDFLKNALVRVKQNLLARRRAGWWKASTLYSAWSRC